MQFALFSGVSFLIYFTLSVCSHFVKLWVLKLISFITTKESCSSASQFSAVFFAREHVALTHKATLHLQEKMNMLQLKATETDKTDQELFEAFTYGSKRSRSPTNETQFLL